MLGSDKTVVRAGYAIYHDSAWSMGVRAYGRIHLTPRNLSVCRLVAHHFGCLLFIVLGGTPNIGPSAPGGFSQMVGFSDEFPLVSPPATPLNFGG